MNISFLIVTWNARNHIDACLESIQKYVTDFSYEVIVIDNNSADGTALHIEKKFPWVRLIKNKENVGFGRANNQGAKIATGEYLFILNDDTEILETTIPVLYNTAKKNREIGALGCHLVFKTMEHQDSVRRDPHFFDQLIVITKTHNFFPRLIHSYLAKDMDYTKNQVVEQLMGACLFIPRQVFEAAGGFDPRFFIWFEEVDLLKRIREKQQKKIFYTAETALIHHKGTSFGKVASIRKQRYFQKSQRYYFFKHHGLLQALLLTSLHPLGLLLSAGVALLRFFGKDVKKIKHGQN